MRARVRTAVSVFSFACATVTGACGTPAAADRPVRAAGAEGSGASPGASPDPRRPARASIRNGRVPAAVARALRADPDPRSRRAADLLDAIDGAFAAPQPEPGAESPLRAVSPPPKDDSPGTRRRGRDDAARPHGGTGRTPQVRGMSLRRKGASRVVLTVRADGRVPVGIASQPAQGLVRLVLEGTAAPRLSVSPLRLAGVEVTEIKTATASVFVTLRLAPGWRLARRRATRRGASVTLVGPG